MKLEQFPKIVKDRLLINEVQARSVMGLNSLIFSKGSLINLYGYAGRRKSKLVELIYFGLNYNAKRIKHFRKPWVLDLQKSHKVKVSETRISEIKTKIFKRRVLFFSYNRELLICLLNKLKKMRKQNSYSGHGLISRTDKYLTKPGKVRQK